MELGSSNEAQALTSVRCAWHPSLTAHMHDECALDESRIRSMQDDGIAQTVAYACARSAFWSERFQAAGIKPGDIRSASDLPAVPLLDKTTLAAHSRDFWCVPQQDIVDIVTTSGTTGEPLLYPLTRSDVARLGYNEYRSFTCAGLKADDTVLLAVTMDRCFMAGLAYYEGLKQLGATVVRVGSGSPGMLLGMMQRLDATAVVSVPSFLARIADYARQCEVDLAGASVAKLVCIGEPVRGASGMLTPLSTSLADAYGARLYATYGATEIAGSLCECDAGCGGHLHPDLMHLEVVDEAGQPCPDGEVGELVATTFRVEAMPLIRFRTGDLTSLTQSPCPCGRRTPRIGPIVGRLNQMLKLKGTTVYPLAVQQALQSIAGIERYVLVARSAGPLSDTLEVVVALSGPAETLQPRIEAQLQAELKVTPSVRVATIEDVEALQHAQDTRKQRVFVDLRDRRGAP